MPALIRVALLCDYADGCVSREETEVTPEEWAGNAGWALSESALPHGWTRVGNWAWGFGYYCPTHSHMQITAEEWQENKEEERQDVTHPCDRHPAAMCMCKGACSCHFAK